MGTYDKLLDNARGSLDGSSLECEHGIVALVTENL